jgi:hypothetical protein
MTFTVEGTSGQVPLQLWRRCRQDEMKRPESARGSCRFRLRCAGPLRTGGRASSHADRWRSAALSLRPCLAFCRPVRDAGRGDEPRERLGPPMTSCHPGNRCRQFHPDILAPMSLMVSFTPMRPTRATAEIFWEGMMQKVLVLVLLALALTGGAATVSTLISPPVHGRCEGSNC